MGRFKETGHQLFKSIGALSREILKGKGGRDTTHFDAESQNTELLFRTIHSGSTDSESKRIDCGEIRDKGK